MPRKKSSPNFEKSLNELEKIVAELEEGDISLEESLQSFEKGIELTRACQKALSEAEQKIQILIENGGEAKFEPFNDA
ncbi:MAG: exodeoxyribonuclease VII small subunit [Gammaproteobacteria bacterium]|nr:MAG: exodeoxyribonuclease VII small subunit [Gammaproteobacteria bacterium]